MANGMFSGILLTPEQVQESRRQAMFEQARTAASLTPQQQALMLARESGQNLGNVISGLFGVEDPELKKARDFQNAAMSIKDRLTPEQLSNPSIVYGEMARAAIALGYPNEALQFVQAAQRQRPAAQKPLQIDLGDRVQLRDPITGRVIEEIRKGTTPGQAAKPTPATEGQKTLDRDFAKEYSDFVAAGGSAQLDKILTDLRKVEALLESDKTITGVKVSVADATGTLSALFPDAATAKDLAGGVIQSNLRAILGGQFAQKEGEALLARAYNPAQPQKDNLERIRNLRKQIETAAAAKKRAVDYWETNDATLAGFKGDLGKVKPAKASSTGVPAGVDPAVWSVMTPEEKALWQ